MSIYLLCLLSMGCLSLPAQKKLDNVQQKIGSADPKEDDGSYWHVGDCQIIFHNMVSPKEAPPRDEDEAYFEFCDDSQDRCAMTQIANILGCATKDGPKCYENDAMTREKLELAMMQADRKDNVIYQYCQYMLEAQDQKFKRSTSQKNANYEFPTKAEYLKKLEQFTNVEERSFSFWALGECSQSYQDLVKKPKGYFPSALNFGKIKYNTPYCHDPKYRCLVHEIVEILGKGEKITDEKKIEKKKFMRLMDQEIKGKENNGAIYKYCVRMNTIMRVYFDQCMNGPKHKISEGKFIPARRRKQICRKEVHDAEYSKIKNRLLV